MNFDQAFTRLMGHEGGYSDHPNDPGKKTMWGITEAVARANGFTGDIPILTLFGVVMTGYVAGMTSRLFNYYEEGTWTPSQGGGLTVVGAFTSTGTYTRTGRKVTVTGIIEGATSVATSAAGVMVAGLPYSSVGFGTGTAVNNAITASVGTVVSGTVIYSSGVITATPKIFFTIPYFV